jgi:DNA-binding beta-propeller fold protein YncE
MDGVRFARACIEAHAGGRGRFRRALVSIRSALAWRGLGSLAALPLVALGLTPAGAAAQSSSPPVLLTQFGSLGTGNGQFQWPWGVAVDSKGNVWVADEGNDRVQELARGADGEYEYRRQFGSIGTGDGQFTDPLGVAVAPNGKLWVVNGALSGSAPRVEEFNVEGETVTYAGEISNLGTGEGVVCPDGIAVDAKGDVWVADYCEDRVAEFNEAGHLIQQIGSEGTGDGQFRDPEWVAIAPNGNVLVSDHGNNRVQVFKEGPDGKYEYLTQFGSTGTDDGQFESPQGIAVGPQGDVWVADISNHRVQVFTESGEYITQYGSSATGSGQPEYPMGVAVDPSGDVHVTDLGNDDVETLEALTGSGAEVNPAPTGPPTPSSGWSVAFADGFGAPLGTGTGQDNDWHQAENEDGFTNFNEIEVMRAKQAKTGPEGLELACTYRGGSGRKYECGAVDTGGENGTHAFAWRSGKGETWAFECYCKWPLNTGEADPAWWADGAEDGVENETDFFEGFGWGEPAHSEKEYDGVFPTVVGLGEYEIYGVTRTLGFNPELGFHRYTTVFTPNGSKYVVAEYVDGVFKWSYEVTYPTDRQTFTNLNVSYALREYTEGFTSGTRDFDIRSVAVYEDGAHAGQDIEGGGVAPGTVIR